MRYSSKKDDPGYAAWISRRNAGAIVNAFLDGVPQPECVTADDEKGYVRRCKLDEDGYICAVGDEIIEEVVYGVVTFAVRNG